MTTKAVIVWPSKGIDLSSTVSDQTPGTCPVALNVRSRSPVTGRGGGAKRCGTIKAFLNAVGQAEAGAPGLRITGRARCIRSWNESINTAGSYINVVDDFSQYSLNLFPNQYARASVGFSANYTIFQKFPGSSHSDPVNAFATTAYPYLPFSVIEELPNGLYMPGRFMQAIGQSATDDYILADNWRTSNRKKVTIDTFPYSSDNPFYGRGATVAPSSGQCTLLGPVIRGSWNYASFYTAYLESAGTVNQVRLRVYRVVGATTTTMGTSSTFTLSGAAEQSQLTIELVATSATVVARVVWPDEAIDETVSVSDTTLNTNDRTGVINATRTNAFIQRRFSSVEHTKLVPLPIKKVYSISPGDADRFGQKWQIPALWDSIYVTDAIVRGHVGTTTPYQENGSRPTIEYPMIDRIGEVAVAGGSREAQIYGGQSALSAGLEVGEGGVNNGSTAVSRTRILMPSAFTLDADVGALTESLDVQLQWSNTDGSIDDCVGAIFRLDGIQGTYP